MAAVPRLATAANYPGGQRQLASRKPRLPARWFLSARQERQQEWAWAAVMYQTAITGTKAISDHGMGTQTLARQDKQASEAA